MALQSTPQTPPPISREAKQFERASAKKRVLDAYLAGQDWLGVAASNAVSVSTARRITMTVEVMSKLEEYLDEQADMTMAVMKERLLSDVSAEVSISSIHRALHGMLYTVKGLRIEKATTNNDVNKTKRKEFAIALNKHVFAGDMIVYHDETNFNIYLARNQGWVRTGKRAVVTLPPPKGKNLYVQCGVSPGNGLVLLRTHEGSIRMEENARFVADLFVAALNSDEYKEWQQAGYPASCTVQPDVQCHRGLLQCTEGEHETASCSQASRAVLARRVRLAGFAQNGTHEGGRGTDIFLAECGEDMELGK
ncbi:hypothetical protein ON010_g259 [Phytophthora cinnamomi]|nr:hypothetical protein ON010_g259 [Phytophthora cinnamomi]